MYTHNLLLPNKCKIHPDRKDFKYNVFKMPRIDAQYR